MHHRKFLWLIILNFLKLNLSLIFIFYQNKKNYLIYQTWYIYEEKINKEMQIP